MIRGWRNDPRWVEFYKKRDEERIDRAVERERLRIKMEMDERHAKRLMLALEKKPLTTADWGY